MAETVQSEVYQEFMKLREQAKEGIEKADSEFMLITYTQLLRVLNKRQNAANRLNIVLENKAIKDVKKTKREELAKKKDD